MLAANAGNVIAMALGGVVAVLAVCAGFYAIGRGEDRDRAASSAAEAVPEPPAEDAAPPQANPPPPRSRSPRSAKRRRRP